jgi:predicted ATPase
MIERIIIESYRRFVRLDFEPNRGMNIIVGDNESGKSTLLEAIALALHRQGQREVGERGTQPVLVSPPDGAGVLPDVRDRRSLRSAAAADRAVPQ